MKHPQHYTTKCTDCGSPRPRPKKERKVSKIEYALIALAQHIERSPFNEYKVMQEIMDILNVEKLPPNL